VVLGCHGPTFTHHMKFQQQQQQQQHRISQNENSLDDSFSDSVRS
jgi:hypothetical protein